MARPAKGDRPLIGARVERPYSDKLSRYVQLMGTTKSDYVASLIKDAMDQVDLENLEHEQEPLPLTA